MAPFPKHINLAFLRAILCLTILTRLLQMRRGAYGALFRSASVTENIFKDNLPSSTGFLSLKGNLSWPHASTRNPHTPTRKRFASQGNTTPMGSSRGASIIEDIDAREIFDSRGLPTVEVDLKTSLGNFRAAVPSGASTGIYEALELRDSGSRFHGKGCVQAVQNIYEKIKPALLGLDVMKQRAIDELMVQQLDSSKNEWGWPKRKLGANAILPVSMAVCRAAAAANGVSLYEYIALLKDSYKSETSSPKIANAETYRLPIPFLNVLNGGSHAGNRLPFQELMIVPTGAENFKHAMQMGSEIYQNLKKFLKKNYGQDSINVGDEGGFAPNIQRLEEGLDVLMTTIEASGYKNKVKLALDVAASEMYTKEGLYNLNFKDPKASSEDMKTSEELAVLYEQICKKYPIISLEDPFDQDDWKAFQGLTKRMGDSVQIVGDDLLVTNQRRINEAVRERACNALLLKLNQVGSVTESIDAANDAMKEGWNVMVSHRSGETEDTFIADMAVGLGCGQIKSGAPCRSERLAKYNQLMRIEESLGGSRSSYPTTKNFLRESVSG